jgi:hypothetical protein
MRTPTVFKVIVALIILIGAMLMFTSCASSIKNDSPTDDQGYGGHGGGHGGHGGGH